MNVFNFAGSSADAATASYLCKNQGASIFIDREASLAYEDHLSLQSFVGNVFEQQAVSLVKVDEVLCSDGYCPVGNLSISYYEDDDHLNVIGNVSWPVVRKTFEA